MIRQKNHKNIDQQCCQPAYLKDSTIDGQVRKIFERYLDVTNYDPNEKYWDSTGITLVKLFNCNGDSIQMKTLWASIPSYDVGSDTIILKHLIKMHKKVVPKGFCLMIPIQFNYAYNEPSSQLQKKAKELIAYYGKDSHVLNPQIVVEKYVVMH